MTTMTPEARTARAKHAAKARWERLDAEARTEATAPARAAALASAPADHFRRMAALSHESRRHNSAMPKK